MPAPQARSSSVGARVGRGSGQARNRSVRLIGTAVIAAYIAALVSRGSFSVVLGLLVAADAVAALTLWRIDPRRGAVGRARLLENLGYLTVFVTVLLATVVAAPPWAGRFGDWQWYPAAVVAGLALMWLGGTRLRPLWSGQLAFVAGRKPRSHAVVNGLNMSAGAAAEEVMYRSVALTGAGIGVVAVSMLGGLAFVLRHHLPGWAARRSGLRTYATELGAAAALLTLTVLSHSIYPAVLAHLVNNAPVIALEVQRGWQGQES